MFIFADTGSLFDMTMHQLPAERYWFKIIFSDAAQLPLMNVTCYSRGDRVESRVTTRCMWQGFVSLEGIWLPIAATCQFQQLFAAQQYYVACRKGMWGYHSSDFQMVQICIAVSTQNRSLLFCAFWEHINVAKWSVVQKPLKRGKTVAVNPHDIVHSIHGMIFWAS